MHRRIAFALLAAAAAFLWSARESPAAEKSGDTRIAVLKGAEVWTVDLDGRRMEQITRTGGTVEDFRFAPASRYLAYAKILRYVEEPGLWEKDEKPPQRAVSSIVIMNLTTRKIVKEIWPGDGWIYLDKWVPGDKLLFHGASGFDVTGIFEFDVRSGARRQLDDAKGSQLVEADHVADGSLIAYVDESGLGPQYRQNLHLVNVQSGADAVRVSKRSIASPKISEGKTAVAFVEVVRDGGRYRDRLWLYQMVSGTLTSRYEGPAMPKSWGIGGLSWSPDDRFITMSFGGTALIFDALDPSRPQRVPGTGFCWVAPRQAVIAGQAGVDVYDVDSQVRKPLVRGGSQPQCLTKQPR